MNIGDHGALRIDAFAACKHGAFCCAGLDRDAAHRRAEPHLAAGGGNRPNHRGDDRVGPALPERHAEALVRHRLQVGKQRAAGAVRREIEMHAPCGHHRLELGVVEILVEPLPRRGDEETRRVGDPGRSARAPRRKDRAQRLQGRQRRGEQREEMRRVLREGRDHSAPALRVGCAQRRDPVCRRVEIAFDAEPAAVGKRRREALLGADKGEALRKQSILVGGKERRAGKQAQIHRIEVMTEAGPRDLAGLDRAAGDFRAFEDGDLPALGGEVQRRRQPVDSGPDHDRVVRHSRTYVAPDDAGMTDRPSARSLASADISYLKCRR